MITSRSGDDGTEGSAPAASRPALDEHQFFFLGVDAAPSESHRSDDGALTVGRATPKGAYGEEARNVRLTGHPGDWYFDYVHARRLTHKEKASARQYSGIIHQWHRAFRFEKIMADPGGGGTFVKRELAGPKQLINGAEADARPICDLVDGPKLVTSGDFILHMYKRGDPGIEMLWPNLAGDDLLNDAAYSEMKTAVETAGVAWPGDVADWLIDRREEYARWPTEQQWALKNLQASVSQFNGLILTTRPDGLELRTRRGARQFEAAGKKDLLSSGMYCYLAFLVWLRMGDWERQEDDGGGYEAW
jgi:hypothetical protein